MLQFYMERMYASRVVTREVMAVWECKAAADMTWANATDYFEDEVVNEET